RLDGDYPTLAEDFIQRNAPANANVENFSGNIGRVTSQKVRLDSVLHVGKVPRLLAISEDDWRRVFQERRAELRKHAGIRRAGILPRPKDIEITQRHVFENVTAPDRLPVKLAHELRDPIRR